MAIDGVGFKPQIPKHEQDAQQYAKDKNISLEEARAELKAQHGDPPRQDAKIGANYDTTSIYKNDSATPPKDMDPDDYAKIYAKINNITVEAAKTELKQKFGEPDRKSEGGALNFIA